MTSLSQARNAKTMPLIRARGLKLADNNPNSLDDTDDQFNLLNPLQLQGSGQDDSTPDNATQANGTAQGQQQPTPTPTPGPANPPAQPTVKTINDFLSEVGNYYRWFAEDQSGLNQQRLTALNSTTHIETYQRTEDGFQLTVAGSNRSIRWILAQAPDGTPAQRIQGQSDGFDQSDANAMVALSALHGWKRINVHGNQHERELLWYAALSQGLQVDGFEPDHNSDVYKQWQSDQATKNPDDDKAPPVINGGGSSTDPSVTPGQNPAQTPPPPVNDNTPPADNSTPPALPEDQEPDLSGLDKDQLTYLLERYTAEEKYAIAKNDPNLKEIQKVKEAAVKALADLAAKDATPADGKAPADADKKPADAATPPADVTTPPAEKPAKKAKPAHKSTNPAQDTTATPPATKDAAAKDKFAGGKTTDAFNDAKDKKAPAAPTVPAPATPATGDKPAQSNVEHVGQHRTGKGHTNAKSVIAREQKKVAAPK